MSTTLTIDSVTTEDVAPTTAPHKISNVTGYKNVTIAFTPVTSDASPIRSMRIIFNSTVRNWPTGKLMYNLGAVCGLDRCGAPGVKPLAAAHNVQRTHTDTYPETGGPADGGYPVYVWALSGTQGWN